MKNQGFGTVLELQNACKILVLGFEIRRLELGAREDVKETERKHHKNTKENSRYNKGNDLQEMVSRCLLEIEERSQEQLERALHQAKEQTAVSRANKPCTQPGITKMTKFLPSLARAKGIAQEENGDD